MQRPQPPSQNRLGGLRTVRSNHHLRQLNETGTELQNRLTKQLREYKTFAGENEIPAGISKEAQSALMRFTAQKLSLDQMLAMVDEKANDSLVESMGAEEGEAANISPSGNADATAKRQQVNAAGNNEFQNSYRIVPDPIFEDAAFLIWMKENPNAGPQATRLEMQRRNQEKMKAEKVARVRNLQEWQKELTQLQQQADIERMNRQKEEEAQGFIASELEKMDPMAPKPPPRGGERRKRGVGFTEEQQLKEQQRRAWEVFNGGDGSPKRLQEQVPLQRVLETDSDPLMHEWVQQTWPENTDKHEEAVLKIQCCFRTFVAKERAAMKRYHRQQTLKLTLQNEEQAMLAWEVAVATQQAQDANAAAVDKTFKAVQVFSSHMKSTIQYRRKAMSRAQAARAEVETYAATRIQSIFRGYLARRLVKEMKNPKIAEDRELHRETVAATKIQACARRYLVKVLIERKLKLVTMMQQLFRRYRAINRLADMRKHARLTELYSLKIYAASSIQRVWRNTIKRRRLELHVKLLKNSPAGQLLLLTWRGFVARSAVHKLLKGKRDRAALKVQCCYRQFCARRRVEQRKVEILSEQEAESKEHAAIIIQHHAVGWIARRDFREHQKRRTSAQTIQRCWAGHKGRDIANAVRQQRSNEGLVQRQTDAALMIQALFRGHRVRTHQGVEQDAAFIIQGAMRTAVAKRQAKQAHRDELSGEDLVQYDAADVIGRFYVAYIRWPMLRKFVHRQASIIAKFFGRVPAYKTVLKRRKALKKSITGSVTEAAAITVQQAVRQHQAKKHVQDKMEIRAVTYIHVREDEAAKVIQRFMFLVAAKKKLQRQLLQNKQATPVGAAAVPAAANSDDDEEL